jgi:hypothetical protein
MRIASYVSLCVLSLGIALYAIGALLNPGCTGGSGVFTSVLEFYSAA